MTCIICDKPATKKFTLDLDIQGIGSCEIHIKDVQLAYIMLLQGDKELYEDFIEGLRKKNKRHSG